ncbi:hypothetical protein FAZ24_02390, partial [Klebsiella pneumoniae]
MKKSLALTILRNVCGQLSNPGRGFSSPPVGATCEKKARTCVRALQPRSGVLIPPGGCHMRKKSPYLRTSSS